MSWWTPANQSYAYRFLVNAGLAPYGAAGLVSRWKNVEAPNGPASRGGYLGRAWGIGQWLGPRLPAIDGNPNFDDQLAYVVQELNSGSDGSGGVALRLLSTAPDAYTGALGASAYERAAGSKEHFPADNFTQRTANGIPEVLANAGSVPTSDSGNIAVDYSSESPVSPASVFPDNSSGVTAPAVLGIAAAVVFVIWWMDL